MECVEGNNKTERKMRGVRRKERKKEKIPQTVSENSLFVNPTFLRVIPLEIQGNPLVVESPCI
jgi:hypothetical protein